MVTQVDDLEERLSSARNQIEQLSHSLSDKDAQLNIESNNCKVSTTLYIICSVLFYVQITIECLD